MSYRNPILPGLHADPSICRVGEDYYMANSSFEYFPGIPLFHSRDLVNWEPIGHCLTRPNQVELSTKNPNCMGIFAPTLRYHNGRFYVVSTNIGGGPGKGGNFLIWADDIRGEWSDPLWIDLPGIDPSLYFEGDRVYYTGTSGDIFLAEIDLATGHVLGEKRSLWAGTGGADPEGPHVYKIGEYYYLFISEGGTAQCHMLTVARSHNLVGPYEACPRNPVLTNRSRPSPVRAIGHADLVQTPEGAWWAVCLGIRVVGYPEYHLLGRETYLVSLKWDNEGWPVFGTDGSVQLEMEAQTLPAAPVPARPTRDEFDSATLDLSWNFIALPAEGSWSLSTYPGHLTLWGTAHGLSADEPVAWVGRRQEHLAFTAKTLLEFSPGQHGEEAGLAIYLNNCHHYSVALAHYEGKRVLRFRRQIGSLWKVECEVEYSSSRVELVLEGTPEFYRLGYQSGSQPAVFLGQGEARYLSTETGGRFTGNYIALFCSAGGQRTNNAARFDWFDYLPG